MPDLKKKYLDSGGSICPYCESSQIEGGSIEIDGQQAWQKVSCLDCEKDWDDIYNLVDVDLREEG